MRGEFPAPVQCGRLRVAQLEAEPPVVRLHAAEPRQHAGEPWELDGGRLGEGFRGNPLRLEQLARDLEERFERGFHPGRGRAGEREAPDLLEVVGERHLGPLGDELGEQLEAGVRVDPARARPRDRRRPSNGRPEACASRCRTVEPGGPAGSSRSTIPSSAATRAASAVASFVTDAHPKTRSRLPVRGLDAAGDRDRRVLARPAVDLPQGLHRADTIAVESQTILLDPRWRVEIEAEAVIVSEP